MASDSLTAADQRLLTSCRSGTGGWIELVLLAFLTICGVALLVVVFVWDPFTETLEGRQARFVTKLSGALFLLLATRSATILRLRSLARKLAPPTGS
jgi:hypothetical protein